MPTFETIHAWLPEGSLWQHTTDTQRCVEACSQHLEGLKSSFNAKVSAIIAL